MAKKYMYLCCTINVSISRKPAEKTKSHQSKAVWRFEWLAMATGSPGITGTTGPRPCPTPSWKEAELSGLGEGTEEEQKCDLSVCWSFFVWFVCFVTVCMLIFHKMWAF